MPKKLPKISLSSQKDIENSDISYCPPPTGIGLKSSMAGGCLLLSSMLVNVKFHVLLQIFSLNDGASLTAVPI